MIRSLRDPKVLLAALQIQIAPALGYLFCALVGFFYYVSSDPRFNAAGTIAPENITFVSVGLCISVLLFFIGYILSSRRQQSGGTVTPLSISQGARTTVRVRIIACAVSALVLVLAGFPDPTLVSELSWLERFINGFFESMSGFTTTGSSVAPSVEVFPRSILMRRSTMHLIGGMGIAYLAVTVRRHFTYKREEVINSEAESHIKTHYATEEDAIQSGKDFAKVYLLLTAILFVLLTVSGLLRRTEPYTYRRDSLFDAVNHAFATMGTGGFSIRNTSIGLPDAEGVIRGMQNPVSERIIAFFMMFAGMNFSLWYIAIFKGKRRQLWANVEFKIFLLIVILVTLGIRANLVFYGSYASIRDALRYSFFHVTDIMSTTGFATTDFAIRPAGAIGILFVCYAVGSMVGSTAGGPKVIRYIIAALFSKVELDYLLRGKKRQPFVIDGVEYDDNKAGLIVFSLILYFVIFFIGIILLMQFSNTMTLPDGTTFSIDFLTAMVASLANLGNIGPAISFTNVNVGPTGNYFAFSIAGKIIMIALMFIGRVDVLTFLMLFISSKAEAQRTVESSIGYESFDEENAMLKA